MKLKTIYIENKPEQRIIINYDPLNNNLIIVGQYKKHGNLAIDFISVTYDLSKLTNNLMEIIYEISNILDSRIQEFVSFNENLNQIDYFTVNEKKFKIGDNNFNIIDKNIT